MKSKMKFKHSLRPTYAYKWVSSFRIIGGKKSRNKMACKEKKILLMLLLYVHRNIRGL